MPTGCVVPHCRSGTFLDIKKSRDTGGKPVSLFNVPKCPILLQKWQESLRLEDRMLKPKSRICELHFNEEDIIKTDETRLVDGMIHKIARQRYKLRNGAVPIIIHHTDHMNVEINGDVPPQTEYREQDMPTRNIQKVYNDGSIGTDPMSQEVISSSDEQTEIIVHENEDRTSIANEKISNNYPFVQLKQDLIMHKLNMPPGWAYIFEKSCVRFTYVDPLKYVIRMFCIVDTNMKVQITTFNSREISDVDEQFSTSIDVVNYLNKVAKMKCCDGTGIGSSYSESCHGFVLDEDGYERSRGYQRCISCRKLRKIQLAKEQDVENFQTRLETKNRKVKTLQCMNTCLKKKVKTQHEKIEKMKINCNDIRGNSMNDAISTLPIEQQEVVRACLAAANVCGPTGNRYSLQFIYETLLLSIKSRKAYEHIRQHKLLPLPCRDTINRYLSNMDSAYGFNMTTFECLWKKGIEMMEEDRRGVVLIDEMKLTEGISFNKKEMIFNGFTDLGSHTPKNQEKACGDHALVIMFQPFRGRWVQSIACFLSRGCASGTILHKLILECVNLLENSGFRVDAVTTDGAQWNRGMWKHYGIATNNVSCAHPIDENRRLWFNSDWSHLLKNLRNFIVSHPEIWTPDGVIKLKHWEALLKIEKSDNLGLKVAFKLSKHHVKPEGYQKMSVPLASELFSPQVAAAMCVYKEHHEELVDCGPTVEFIKRINRLNIAMTSRTPIDALYINSRNYKAIQEFLDYLQAWESEAKSKAYYFIPPNTSTGLKVTLRTTLEITEFLVVKCSYNYLMTARLTQDALERFFGMMRNCCGSNDHPDPKMFAQVYRLVSVYSLVKPPRNSNIQGPEILETILNMKDNLQDNSRKRKWKDNLNAIFEARDNQCTEQRSLHALELDHDYNVSSSPEYAQSYYAGFIGRKAQSFTKCRECLATLYSDEPKERDKAIEELTKGYLIYPSDTLFCLTKLLEEIFLQEVGIHSVHCDSLLRVLEKVSALEHIPLVGCNEHNQILTKQIIEYYLVSRAHSSAKRFNDINNTKRLKTKKQRKLAKLT